MTDSADPITAPRKRGKTRSLRESCPIGLCGIQFAKNWANGCSKDNQTPGQKILLLILHRMVIGQIAKFEDHRYGKIIDLR